MLSKKSTDVISDSVKEQLGIEEDFDYVDDILINQLQYKLSELEGSVEAKTEYINRLELELTQASRKIDTLEKEFYSFKTRLKR